MRPPSRCIVAALAMLTACKSEPTAADIPESLRGYYGRTADDILHGTLGLEIGATELKLSEMVVQIKDAKLVGDDYQVALAEVQWAKEGDKVPTQCKGTIARNGERLLLRLFEIDSDKPCDSILEGEWNAWTQTAEFPAGLQGWFGASWAYSRVFGVRIGSTAIVDTEGVPFELRQGLVWDGRQNELVIVEAEVEGTRCRGSITLKEDRLTSNLQAIEDGSCPDLYGERWTVDEAKLPKQPLTNGKVDIAIDGHEVKITSKSEPKVSCTQEIVRTALRATTDRQGDGIPVLGGIVLALGEADFEGDVDGCKAALGQLDATICAERFGPYCNDELMQALAGTEQPDPLCPSHIVIGDAEVEGRRVAFLPVRDPVNLVCFETTARFR